MPKVSNFEKTYSLAAFCFLNGVVPRSKSARDLINCWHRERLLKLRKARA